ncbi:hypothetical protein B0T20DRAFT_401022 [Sordaria brevicollis]|uniref:Small ribosomal subunit protein bS18m n=1 Tax=Sordaria brevicollis TaxID=83679 RepID=A0AAE0PNW5_SORBR|nr:hypothetical protein B0T20DRAFT_401022 [Sordaria brevicollis]
MSSSRQFLSSALRQSRAAGQSTAQFSTSSPAAAIRNIPTTSFQNAPRTNNNNTSSSSSSAGSNQYKSDMFNLLNSGSGSRNNRRGGSDDMEGGGQRSGSGSVGQSQKVQELLQSEVTANNYLRQMKRRWTNGDVYAPRDLGAYEMKGKPAGAMAQMPKVDVVDELGFSPLDNYRNFSLISDYITPFGRIRHSKETGLRPVNQRKIAKMVRRAIGMGIHPSVHKHPEILKASAGRHLLPLVVPKGQAAAANKTKNFDGEDEH